MDNVYLWVSKQSRKIVMTADLEENLIKTMNGGSSVMVHSLAAYCTLNKKNKKKISKQQARDNYCKSVLFLWGYMQFELDQVDDNTFFRAQLMSAYILFGVLSRKEFESLYLGAGLNKKKLKGDYPKLCHDIVKWFNINHELPSVQSITTTGKHIFALRASSGQLSEKHSDAFYRAGSLCEEGFEAINCMEQILVKHDFKLNF